MRHFNGDMFNAELFNDSGIGAFVPVIVTTPDPGVSFTVFDEAGGIDNTEDNNGC